MKLLVDEMYTPAIAEQLQARGLDAVSVHAMAELGGLGDEALLRWAHSEERALLTENVSDFLIVHAGFLRSGERHSGIVLASNAGFPRGKASTVGALVIALDALLRERAALDTDVWWL